MLARDHAGSSVPAALSLGVIEQNRRTGSLPQMLPEAEVNHLEIAALPVMEDKCKFPPVMKIRGLLRRGDTCKEEEVEEKAVEKVRLLLLVLPVAKIAAVIYFGIKKCSLNTKL